MAALLVFLLGVVAAGIRVLFVRRSTSGDAAGAATYHTIISASAAYGTVLYVNANALILPLLAGCWLGTWATVKYEARSKQ